MYYFKKEDDKDSETQQILIFWTCHKVEDCSDEPIGHYLQQADSAWDYRNNEKNFPCNNLEEFKHHFSYHN